MANKISNNNLSLLKAEQVDYYVKNELLIQNVLKAEDLSYGEKEIIKGLVTIQKVLETKLDTLLTENQHLQSQIAELVDYQNSIIAEKLKKSELKMRLKQRRKKTDRDCISLELFDQALAYVLNTDKTPRLKDSLCLGMALMYFFGVRVSNCLILENAFFEDLLSNKSEIKIPTVKTKVNLTFTKPGVREIDKYFRNYIKALLAADRNAISYDRSY